MNSTLSTPLCAGDYGFGPSVDTCGRTFDFSLTFEESILSIVPSVLLLLLAPVRLNALRKKPNRVGGRGFQIAKLIAIALFAGLQLALLIVFSIELSWQTKTSIAAAVLSFVDAPIFCLLSYTEHTKSIRPSSLLGVYLFFSLVFDAVRLRTMWLIRYDSPLRGLFTASLSLKLVLLFLEAKEKRRYLGDSDRKRGPEETSSVFNKSVFWWLNRLLNQGFRNVLSMNDLYPIDEEMNGEFQAENFNSLWATARPGSNRLLKVLFKQYTWRILSPMIPRLALVAFTFCQPLLINRFLDFLQHKDESINIGYGLIGAYGVVYFGIAISTGFFWHGVFRWITLIRGTLISAIYSKTTEISITALDNSAAVTLMSADVERIVQGMQSLHELWANIISVGLATWLLERELGLACIAPLAIALATAGATVWMTSYVGQYQVRWVDRIQTRIGITSTMLSSMKGVKMTGLTERLTELIQRLRLTELAAGIQYRMLMIRTACIAFFPSQSSGVVTFAVFIAIESSHGRQLDTTRMFTSLSLLTLLTQPLSQVFQAFASVRAAFACVSRIQSFLVAESRADHRLHDLGEGTVIATLSHSESYISQVSNTADIELKSLTPNIKTARIDHQAPEVISVREGAFGWKTDEPPVLNDINFDVLKGSLTIIVGPVASGKTTLLKALLGETPSSKGFVHIATTDFAFCDQTPWLLSQTIQQNVIGFAPLDPVWYQTCVYSSCLADDIAYFPNGDDTMIGSNGISLSGGQKQRLAIARAIYARKSVAIFDDVFSGLDKTTVKKVFERIFGSHGVLRKSNTTSIIATHAVDLLPSADQIIALGSHGRIVQQGSFAELNARDGYVQSFTLNALDDTESEVEEEDEASLPAAVKDEITTEDPQTDKSRQTGDFTVYRYFFAAAGLLPTLSFFVMSAILSSLFSFPPVWLKWWSDAVNQGETSHAKWLSVYGVIEGSSLVALYLVAYTSYNVMGLRASSKLHLVVLEAVMAAPMQFFSVTDTGTTLNRFSQDMQLIDTDLSQAMLNFLVGVFNVIGQAILIAISSGYIAITYPFILFIFFVVQKFYLRTSRQLRFMDIEAKSPLYTQFLESLSGLATLRAFGWAEKNRTLNSTLLDEAQKPFYLLYMIQRWLTMVMDLVGMGLALAVVGLAVQMRDSVSPGFAGVALVNIIGFTETLKYVLMHWTSLETSIGAVSRVKSFAATTASEHQPQEDTSPPSDWPTNGLVQFNNISASYKGENSVLKDISLTIRPGEKIGICGPSGSGKSSLVLAIFRMIELQSGDICIDGKSVLRIPRESIRSLLNAIPQDPYFLAGTIRANLDPFDAHGDNALEASLRKVELWATISTRGGLDAQMDVDFLSHGQRQLFCLARAILRPGNIVVLDEATSSVDRRTDALMQRIIRDEFKSHTIIAVAHRLETILDFDRIVVLERGVLKECDPPAKLLASEGSLFRTLYETYEKRKDDDSSRDQDVSRASSVAGDAA